MDRKNFTFTFTFTEICSRVFGRQCLLTSISHKQYDLEAVLFPMCSLFLELPFAMQNGLVNVVICGLLGAEWIICS
jgi:hypothetical protein